MTARTRSARHLSIRNVPPELPRSLEEERRRRHASLNQTALDLLSRARGLAPEPRPSNGLEKHAGGWTDEDLRELDDATACFEQSDEDFWKSAATAWTRRPTRTFAGESGPSWTS